MHDADEYPIRLHCFSDTSLRDLICRRVMSSHISQWVEACECRNPCSLRSCSSTLSVIRQKSVCTTRVPPMGSCNLPRVTSSRLAYYARHERRTSCRHLMRLLVHAPAEGTTSLLSRSFLLTTNTLNLLAFDLGFHYCTRGVHCLIFHLKTSDLRHSLLVSLSVYSPQSLIAHNAHRHEFQDGFERGRRGALACKRAGKHIPTGLRRQCHCNRYLVSPSPSFHVLHFACPGSPMAPGQACPTRGRLVSIMNWVACLVLDSLASYNSLHHHVHWTNTQHTVLHSASCRPQPQYTNGVHRAPRTARTATTTFNVYKPDDRPTATQDPISKKFLGPRSATWRDS